jgi:predicted SnoaL-like aldol condensation-catalyzing enzyme
MKVIPECSINANNKKHVERLCKSVFQNHDFIRLDEIIRYDYIQHDKAYLYDIF